MKKILLFLILSIFSFNVLAQGPSKKCPTCGKSIAACQYRGKHPTKNPPKEKKCTTCSKSLSKCLYRGKHPDTEEAGYDVTFCCNVPSAILYIDGNNNGSISSSHFIKTGQHNIKVISFGYKNYIENIVVDRQHSEFKINLDKMAENSISINGVSYEMIPVSGGTFIMGEKDSNNNSSPAHRVTLSNYYIGQTEVTQALWKEVMGYNPSYFIGDDLPVENVSWYDCQTFLSKLDSITGKKFRLPTEAEWEFAARGGNNSSNTKYSGSDNLDEVGVYCKNSKERTHPIATKHSNELGLYDMSGNVWEWCQDRKIDYSSDAQIDPVVEDNSSNHRIIRGGGWIYHDSYCLISKRYASIPDYGNEYIGFRIAISK